MEGRRKSIVRDNHNSIGRHKGDKLWTNKMSLKKKKGKKTTTTRYEKQKTVITATTTT